MSDSEVQALRESLFTVQNTDGYRFLQEQIARKLAAARESLASCQPDELIQAQAKYRAWEEVSSWLGIGESQGGFQDALEEAQHRRKPPRAYPNLRVPGNGNALL